MLSHSFTIYLDRLRGLLQPQFVLLDPSLLSSSEKDFAYCLRRFKGEGVRFLTVSLPELRKAVDLSFSTGSIITPSSFKTRESCAYPAFLSSHFEKIYDSDGSLLPRPYVTRVKHVRQILEAFYKLEIPYTPATEAQALTNFVSNEVWIKSQHDDFKVFTPQGREILSGAALLARYVFSGFDYSDISPRHGPGSLATGEKGEEKWHFKRHYNALHQVYPYYRYFYHSTNMLGDLASEYRTLERSLTGTSKVVLVPKDSRGPRIITMEPLEYQFLQQGLGRAIMHWLEKTSQLTSGRINFTDQSINQRLALSSSSTGEFATLDLKDASDLLSVHHVKEVFRLKPKLLNAFLSLRTPETLLPDGRVVPLRKYAGMGSALCFPVESFCFWAICVSALALRLNMGLRESASLVYTYGDDIIVPTVYSSEVINALEYVGLRVNAQKSYNSGHFRESCGVDALAGHNVTPIKFRKLFPASATDGTALAAWCSYSNALKSRGYHQLSDTIFKDLESIFGKIPFGISTSPFPCRVVSDVTEAETLNREGKIKYRYNRNYQRIEFRVITLIPTDRPSTLDSWARFNRDILMGTGDDPSIFTLPNATKVAKGWMAV